MAAQMPAQSCGGSFGNPIFTEDFGSNSSTTLQVSGPLNAANATTTYQYTSIYPPNDGYYTIANFSGPNNRGWSWISTPDHTNDAAGKYGNMIIFNADDKKTGEFYRRKVSGLCPNQFYRFSAWILNIVSPSSNQIKPNVTMQIQDASGNLLGSVSTGDIPQDATWKEYFVDFKSAVSSSDVQVVMINNSLGGVGNDLAIDDITFRACGPSTAVSADVSAVGSSGVCDNSSPLHLSAVVSPGTYLNPHFIWQKSSDSGQTWTDLTLETTNPLLSIASGNYADAEQYRFIVGEGGNVNSATCQVISAPLTIKINGYPGKPSLSLITFCENSGSVPASSNTNLNWYYAQIGGTKIAGTPVVDTSVVGSQVFWVSQTANGCESLRTEVTVTVNANPPAPIVNNKFYCFNEIATTLDAQGQNLRWYTAKDATVGSSVAPVPQTSAAGDFYFWVTQTVGGCESEKAEIMVTVRPLPVSELLQDASVCDGGSIILRVEDRFTTAVWHTTPPTASKTLTVTKPGTYEVEFTDENGCVAVQKAVVTAGEIPLIEKINTTENSLQILATGGNPPYYYSLNGTDWQTENSFKNLNAGIYTVYVKSQANSCTAVAQSAVVFIPNVVTPNGDGKNDEYIIKYIDEFPDATFSVFDRYGKLIFTTKNSVEKSWDGQFHGRPLPSGTYWYFLDLGNGYQKTGWILLKNH